MHTYTTIVYIVKPLSKVGSSQNCSLPIAICNTIMASGIHNNNDNENNNTNNKTTNTTTTTTTNNNRNDNTNNDNNNDDNDDNDKHSPRE